MALRARLRNKFVLLVGGFFIAIGTVGAAAWLTPHTPDVWVDTSLAAVHGGITRVHGNPFSGWLVEHSASGDTTLTAPYVDGRLHGTVMARYGNGNLKEGRYYEHGMKEGEHHGWYEDGTPRFIYHYKSDLFDGAVTEWDAAGKLYRLFHYKNGYEHGLQQMWFANGKLRGNYEARNGRNFGLTGVQNCVSVWTPELVRSAR